MHYAVVFVLLLAFVFGLGLLARRLVVPYPILFVIGGLCISFVPNLPQLRLDPDFIFFIFLPPLLYIQAFNTSWRDFRREIRPISMLAIGLVLATTLTVAWVAHSIIPNFPFSAGLILGAIISPPDAIAASAIAQRLGLPRRAVTIIEGESLVNDATSLVLFKMALVAVASSGPILGHAWTPGQFIFIPLGGICVGLAMGWFASLLRARIVNDGAQLVLTLSLVIPYASYLVAELLGFSAVLSVVASGFFVGWTSPEVITSGIRLQAQAVWEMIIYLLNGFIFVLIGLQLPGILAGMKDPWWQYPLLYAAIINVVCIVVRLGWIFPGAYLPRLLIPHIRRTEVCPDWRQVLIIGWCGMRGIVSLAASLALNGYPDIPYSHIIQFIAFSVILTTLVFQGLTLPPLIRYLGVGDDGSDAKEEREARLRMSQAVFEKITEIRQGQKYPVPSLDHVEQIYRDRLAVLQDDLADELGWSDRRHRILSSRRLRHVMLATQRRTLLSLRRNGLIGDDVLHKIEHELDIEEAGLK